ncbi:NUDIX domain-containing protein [Actinacidiphila rubida]|uniref:NUDIX domain-containing protein n=1 Tax=Actinacidiphila rubida TaxID=310780 RepID=A0A1H8TT33_9ACTN|nr:NUDIX hydrolase [Actinacidiphila rubida]SEO93588.1 NUDIX domain-containing protein [Actinacidiphila rubida]
MTASASPAHLPVPPGVRTWEEYAASPHTFSLGAAAIITDQIGRVLLVRPTYREDDRWLLPGGALEAGEHPMDACRREVAEELGRTIWRFHGPGSSTVRRNYGMSPIATGARRVRPSCLPPQGPIVLARQHVITHR